MKIGVDYYPEQWDASFWEKDIEMMMQAGVKIVRIGNASWSMTEPKEGEYDFRNFDDIMRIFKRHNIEVVVCIPTNSPPVWMYKLHPEIIRTDYDGRRKNAEQRNQMCINSPVFIDYVKKLTERMARRYGTDTNIAGWQITDGTELRPCGCDVCKEKFRAWLLDKYDTLEKINSALFKRFDFNSQGAATFLGTKKTVVKMHGAANADTVVASIEQILRLEKGGFIPKLKEANI